VQTGRLKGTEAARLIDCTRHSARSNASDRNAPCGDTTAWRFLAWLIQETARAPCQAVVAATPHLIHQILDLLSGTRGSSRVDSARTLFESLSNNESRILRYLLTHLSRKSRTPD
jgi:hypothetical protein